MIYIKDLIATQNNELIWSQLCLTKLTPNQIALLQIAATLSTPQSATWLQVASYIAQQTNLLPTNYTFDWSFGIPFSDELEDIILILRNMGCLYQQADDTLVLSPSATVNPIKGQHWLRLPFADVLELAKKYKEKGQI